MSRYLLDTHVVVWLAVSPSAIPDAVRDTLAEAEHLYVSAASAYEIAQKVRWGKLPEAEALITRWQELLDYMMAEELDLTARDLLHAGTLAWEHRDPFDRMLAAQAQRHSLPLATKDAIIQSYPGVTCIPW